MRAIPNLPWTALPPTVGVSGKPGQLHGAWSATGDAWSGRSPLAAAATPPIDSTATSAAAAALIVNTLLGTAVLRATKVEGVDRMTNAYSAMTACSPASSSGAAGAVAAARRLATPP